MRCEGIIWCSEHGGFLVTRWGTHLQFSSIKLGHQLITRIYSFITPDSLKIMHRMLETARLRAGERCGGPVVTSMSKRAMRRVAEQVQAGLLPTPC
jgi:hypothetical protein